MLAKQTISVHFLASMLSSVLHKPLRGIGVGTYLFAATRAVPLLKVGHFTS